MRRLPAPLMILVFAASLALAAETDTVTGASPYGFSPGDWPGLADSEQAALMAAWRDELQLSPEQQAVMAEIFMDYGSRLRPLFERGLATAWSIMNVAPKDPDYSLDTEQAAQAAAETAAEIVRTVSEMRSAVNSIMTAEQVATLEALIDERRQRWQEQHASEEEPAATAD
jgi:Spy/CpxP family protein refolding chaperone